MSVTVARTSRVPQGRSVSSPRRATVRWFADLSLLLVGVAFVLPFLWLVLASFDTNATLSAALPATWSLANYADVATPETAGVPLTNSAIMSAGAAAITVVVSVLAAYPLSRFTTRFNSGFLYGVLFATCLPITAMMVPVYALFVGLGLLDSTVGTTVFIAATSLPMAIFMTKNFMDAVPVSLEEAAWVDGASAMQALWRVVVPLMRPGIAVVFIFVFVGAWGNFFVPFILLLSPEKHPAAVSIFTFFGQYGAVAYGRLAAFSLMYSLPVLALYVFVQRVLGGSSAMAGAVKG